MTDTNGYRDLFYSAQDGLRLHARLYGTAGQGALTAVCIPGLTRNARDFHELALFLASDKSDFIVGQIVPFAGGWATNT